MGPIDESQVVTLAGNVHPQARAEFDRGDVDAQVRLDRLVMELKPSPAQQAALDALVDAQHDPHSSVFHHWLTPADYGARFGVSPSELVIVTDWLRSHGFSIDEIPAGHRLIVFSGTAGEVEETFHTAIHRYDVHGAAHIANSEDPQIPAALAGVVEGIVSLHDFRRASQIASRRSLSKAESNALLEKPQMTSGSSHYLFPADFAVIYDLNPLYGAATTGTGSSIAIVGRSDIRSADVAQFRAASGLAANTPQVILAGADPGLVAGDQDESTLDVEWAGAVAPAASVKFEPAASTATTDGVDLSAAYIVNHVSAPVMSTSYGSCEQDMGATELSFYSSLWEQAVSEGMSSFVSSGDSGAAGCDAGSASEGSSAGVNGLCSSAYSTCVGGTEFNEGANAAQYWSPANKGNQGSALSYIPEVVWNESAANNGSGLWASGGGVSQVYAQPKWQRGVSGAVAANGMRAVPDVALTAASHDGYIICENGSWWVIAGTSAASPSFAGIMALVVETEGGAGQGNANESLYSLAEAKASAFHPTPGGNNSVPGVTGFTANGAAYNLATGLGSVDASLLASSWGGGTTPSGPDFKLTASAASGTLVAGKSVTLTLVATPTNSQAKQFSLAVTAPAGVSVQSPATITAGVPAKIIIAVAANASAGTQKIVFTASDVSGFQTVTYTLTVTAPLTLRIVPASAALTVAPGESVKDVLKLIGGGLFEGAVALSVSGLPAGVTATLSANPVTLVSGAGSATLTLSAAGWALPMRAQIVLTAKGDGLSVTKSIGVQISKSIPNQK